jgi:hypothetical protein
VSRAFNPPDDQRMVSREIVRGVRRIVSQLFADPFMKSKNPPSTGAQENDRRILAKAIFRLFDLWELSAADQLALLGLPAEEADAFATMRSSGMLLQAEHLLDRVRSLLRIYRYLGMLYPENAEMAKNWMMSSNPRLNGDAPIRRIQNGKAAGLRSVTDLLEEHLF